MTPNRLQQLSTFVAAVAGEFGRRGRAGWCEAYLRELLLDCDRTSSEPVADRLRVIDQKPEDDEQPFVSQSPWDERAVRNGLAQWVGDHFGTDGLFILDDTGLRTIKKTPAVAAGLTDRTWSVAELLSKIGE